MGRDRRRTGARRLVPGKRSMARGKALGCQGLETSWDCSPFLKFNLGEEGRRTGARRLARKEGAGSCPSPLGEKELGDVPKSFPFFKVHLGKGPKEDRS